MNMHGVFLHILADALGSVVVIISSLIIKFVPHRADDRKHWTVYVDPTLSLIIVTIITISAIPLLKESTYVLLQTVPRHIDVESIKKQLLNRVPEIDGIHELHIWRLSSNAIIASAHLHRQSLTDYMTVADKVKRFFHTMGIHSTTIQYEYQNDEIQTCLETDSDEIEKPKPSQIDCLLSCTDDACNTQTCCTKDSIRSNAMLSASNENAGERNRPTTVFSMSTVTINEQSHPHTSCGHAHGGGSNEGFSHDS
jgi:solute carrier family 30 (zinc transporter), member 1